jgi:uncharacterized protein YcfL
MRRVVTRFMVLSLCLLTGCEATTTPAEVMNKEDSHLDRGRIQWSSSSIRSKLLIENATADRTETGLLRLRLVIRNKSRKDVVVDIRVVFLGEDGFEVEKTNWEPVICTARTQTSYEMVSLGANIDDYQIMIRDPRHHSWSP